MTSESWASSRAVRARMQANRGRDTGPELALRRELHKRGLRYRVNRAPIQKLRRTVDILFPRERIAVFVDGCFWHGCPEHHTSAKTNAGYWSTKVETNRNRDAETTLALQSEGWLVLRFWEHIPASEAADAVHAAVAEVRQVASRAE